MDYRVASNIRGKSLSSLITDRITSGGSVGSSIKSAISDKLKAKGTGIKEKFDPMNIARAMTGGGKLAPAILGKITGRSQSDINYFAGNKKSSTYTKMPSVGQVPSEGFGGSAIEVLNKMLSFMQKNREDDLKRKQISMSFEEEKQSEEQRRHNEFLKVLKDYTSLSGGTTMVKKEEDGGFLDTIKSMLKTAIDSVKNMIENFKILLAPLLEFAKDVGISGLKILGKLIGLLTGSKLFSVLSKISGGLSLALFSGNAGDPDEAKKLAEKQEMAPYISPGVRKQFSRNEIDLFVKENKFFDDDKLKDRKAGFPGADRPTLQKWLDDNPNPNSLYIPDKEKDIQRPVDTPSVRIQTDKEKQLYQNEKKDAGSTPTATPVSPRTNPSSGRNQDSQSGVTGMPYSTPVPSTPTSSAVVGKIQENNNLNLRTPVSFGGSSSPSLSVNNSSTSAPDQTVTSTATTRDDTAILAFVLNRTKSQV